MGKLGWFMYRNISTTWRWACRDWTFWEEKASQFHLSNASATLVFEEVSAKIQRANGPHEDLLTIVKRRKPQWYCHVVRSSGLAKTILQGTVKRGRRQGRHRKRWEDNLREWTGLEFGKSQREVENRKKWRKLVAKSTVVSQWPSRLRDWWWWWWSTEKRKKNLLRPPKNWVEVILKETLVLVEDFTYMAIWRERFQKKLSQKKKGGLSSGVLLYYNSAWLNSNNM